MSELNPFDLYFSKSQTKELEKDLLYRRLLAFLQYKSLADMMVRLHKKSPNESDFETRDILNTGLFPEGFFFFCFFLKKTSLILKERNYPNFFHYGKQHFKDLKSLNPMKVYEKIYEDCLFKKKDFWMKYSKLQGVDKAQIDSKTLIKQVKSLINIYIMDIKK